MNHRDHLESLSKNFSDEALTQFLRAASGKFRPDVKNYGHYLETATKVRTLQKLGQIDYEDGRRLIVLSGQTDNELTTHSGKLKQYDIAKIILKKENLDAGIFVFYDNAGNFRFSWITATYTGTKREFSSFRRYTYFVSPDQPARTFVDQIGKDKVFDSVERITEAFSVEPVTTEFFRAYRHIFEEAEAAIKLKWSDEKKRIYTQRFFNRVMFIAFLERKGWLVFNGRKDYLKTLFTDYYENETNKNLTFHRSRLNTLFFMGLNHPKGDKRKDPAYKPILSQIGDVPYLNGGLFDEEDEDKDGPLFPDSVVAKIITELVYQFNFTVTESTPLDIEVAVDPEMLGRIFEELVTGRHESGSYYTPKPVVAFMCREALKGYLETAMPNETRESLATFVDKNDAKQLKNPELALNALRLVKVCDPACGSGAYLLGMLHELLEQRECLFTARHLDTTTIYERKLEIIQNNLYGVDKDNFAVNIARLRLWLSLIVDYEGETPPPLPNLDFKIECGDSLTAPDPSGGLQPDMFRQQQVQEFLQLKNEFMDLHEGSEKKKKLSNQIDELKKKIEEWAHPKGYNKGIDSFDWQVEFAEVFQPELVQETLRGKMAGIINAVSGQMELTDAQKEGGFDIIVANPPYGLKCEDALRQQYFPRNNKSDEESQSKDSYGLFMARALQLLKPSGYLTFIVSDTWRTLKSHLPLRKLLLRKSTVFHVLDLPSWIFKATVNTCIISARTTVASANHNLITGDLRNIESGNWTALEANLNAVSARGKDIQTLTYARYTYQQKIISTYENNPFFISSPKLFELMGNKKLTHLGNLADVKVGLQTGDNQYYIRKSPNARGGYKIIDESKILSLKELETLTEKEKSNGIDPKNYNGRYFIPYDKGGESDVEEGWLPNYHVPTNYFIDWSIKTVERLKTATTADIKHSWGDKKISTQKEKETRAAVIRNPSYYFRLGITFSDTGIYSPTFRQSAGSVFDQKGSIIIPHDQQNRDLLLGILCSKLARYIYKTFVNHTVSSHVDSIKEFPIKINETLFRKIKEQVENIVRKQIENSLYPYYKHEQISIDELIYNLYELTKEDVREIELWYCRKYPLLAKAQGVWDEVEKKYAENFA